jgi:hypothetical protein
MLGNNMLGSFVLANTTLGDFLQRTRSFFAKPVGTKNIIKSTPDKVWSKIPGKFSKKFFS